MQGMIVVAIAMATADALLPVAGHTSPAAAVWHQPRATAWRGPTPAPALAAGARAEAPRMLLGGSRRIAFASIREREAISSLRSVVTTVVRWSPAEWGVFGVKPLQFSSANTADGARLTYYEQDGSGGGLVEAGSFEMALRGSAFVLTPEGSGWRARGQEALLYKLLLDEVRTRADVGQLAALGEHVLTPTAGVGRLRAKIEGACMYDRKGQYNRF